MSARERLDVATDPADLVGALRAVLDLCREIEPNSFGDTLIEAEDIVRAIDTALGGTP